MQTLNERDAASAMEQATAGTRNPFLRELAFTEAYRRHLSDDPATREVACLRAMFTASLLPMRDGDSLAGHISYPLVGFSPEAGGLGYYCRAEEVRQTLQASSLSPEDCSEVCAMLEFWHGRTTAEKVRAAYPEAVSNVLASDNWTRESGMAFPLYRMAGTVLDYATLLSQGLPGLCRRVSDRADDEHLNKRQKAYLAATLEAISVVSQAAGWYAAQASSLAEACSDPCRRDELLLVADSLRNIMQDAPKTMREAIQLMWLYALMSGTWNYGRMDVYLGPFLARDLARGVLDEAQALALLESLWRLMTDYDNQYNNRVIVGGMGRSNVEQADAFALLALEATRRVLTNQPQLTLRFHRGQNPALYEKALDVLGEGRTFPLLYNDDVNVPSVLNAFRVDQHEAEQYVPFGCGEYVLEHRGIGSPNGVINLAKCLEVTLHAGMDPVSGRKDGLAFELATFVGFEDLWSAYAAQVERQVKALAMQERIEYDVVANQSPYLLLSLLYDDCLARCQPLFAGGARYFGGTLETYGNINASDSLAAIDRLVYQQKQCSLVDIVQACDANFSGQEQLHRAMLAVPKFGNDDDFADAMACRVHEHICKTAIQQAGTTGLHSYLIVMINNWANALFGLTTGATPDGRSSGETLANANNPTPGMDSAGVTAFLNSLIKINPALHAGTVQNMKFSRGLFQRQRGILRALLGVYFEKGGTQAMLTVVDRGDMEAAMREPEKWANLMVRVGGFSARFIDLPKESQLDLLRRTLY